jgi:hypothetical protein
METIVQSILYARDDTCVLRVSSSGAYFQGRSKGGGELEVPTPRAQFPGGRKNETFAI